MRRISFNISTPAATKLLGVVILLTALRGGLYIAFTPPWQAPDEPTHFEYARVLASGGNPVHPQPDLDLQGRVIRSMDRHDYWRYVGVEKPDPLPETFRETPFLSDAPSQLDKNPPLYYLIASLFLRFDRGSSLLGGMYQLRILSLFFTLLTVAVVFAAAREFAPGEGVFQISAAVAAAFLPQFMVIGTSVSPDPLINLLGAALLFAVIRSLRLGWKRSAVLPVLFIFALGGLASYKVFMVLPALALWLAVLYSRSRARFSVRRFLSILAGGLAAAVLLMAVAPRVLPVYSKRLGDLAAVLPNVISGRSSAPPGYWAWFRWELFKSTWFKFGWLKFEFPVLVYHLLLGVTLFSAAGVAWTVIGKDSLGRNRKAATVILIFFVLSVLGAIYFFWGLRFYPASPQGRHFFIVLPAAAILFVLGWGAFPPRGLRNPSCLVLIVGMIVLDLAALFCYLRPAFA